jgi:hypothetical protein
MVNKLVIGLLKAPLVLLVIVSFVASIYAAYKHISGITYSAPVFFAVVIAAYFIGMYLEKHKAAKKDE